MDGHQVTCAVQDERGRNLKSIKNLLAHCRYSETLIPDVWIDAKTVWEVKCADFSISPRHKAAIGLVDAEKGISIRFPRLVRVRDDKAPEDATSAEQVRHEYPQYSCQALQSLASSKGMRHFSDVQRQLRQSCRLCV